MVATCGALLIHGTYSLLFIQFCGIVSPFSTTALWNESLPVFSFHFHSSIQRGHFAINQTFIDSPVLSVSRYACDASALQWPQLTGVLLDYSPENGTLTGNVWHNQTLLDRYTKNILFTPYNTACLNEISSLTLPSHAFHGAWVSELLEEVVLDMEGSAYDCSAQFARPLEVKRFVLRQNAGWLDVQNVRVTETLLVHVRRCAVGV